MLLCMSVSHLTVREKRTQVSFEAESGKESRKICAKLKANQDGKVYDPCQVQGRSQFVKRV